MAIEKTTSIQIHETEKLDLQFSRLILALGVIFGGIVRLYPTILKRFPLLDGGMFYTANGEILANGWRLNWSNSNQQISPTLS